MFCSILFFTATCFSFNNLISASVAASCIYTKFSQKIQFLQFSLTIFFNQELIWIILNLNLFGKCGFWFGVGHTMLSWDCSSISSLCRVDFSSLISVRCVIKLSELTFTSTSMDEDWAETQQTHINTPVNSLKVTWTNLWLHFSPCSDTTIPVLSGFWQSEPRSVPWSLSWPGSGPQRKERPQTRWPDHPSESSAEPTPARDMGEHVNISIRLFLILWSLVKQKQWANGGREEYKEMGREKWGSTGKIIKQQRCFWKQ